MVDGLLLMVDGLRLVQTFNFQPYNFQPSTFNFNFQLRQNNFFHYISSPDFINNI